jgi:hypothetical protein
MPSRVGTYLIIGTELPARRTVRAAWLVFNARAPSDESVDWPVLGLLPRPQHALSRSVEVRYGLPFQNSSTVSIFAGPTPAFVMFRESIL